MSKILTGRDEIMNYLGISRTAFYSLERQGLPLQRICGRLYSHKDLLDEFFKKLIENEQPVEAPSLRV